MPDRSQQKSQIVFINPLTMVRKQEKNPLLDKSLLGSTRTMSDVEFLGIWQQVGNRSQELRQSLLYLKITPLWPIIIN